MSIILHYDSNGNRTSVDRGGVVANAAYNNQDQLTSYDGQTYQYSASGNLVSKQKGTALVEYNYDVFGNLQQVKLSDTKQITYVIDAQNRRVGRAVNGVATHHWIYDSQLRVVGEMDGSGQHVSEFIYGSSQTPDVMIKNGVVYRILQDHLGSPRLIVNSQSGSVLQRIDYDEFGRVLVDSNPGFQPFGFAGGLYDSETGLVRFGARDYDAEVGRWTSKDPILFKGGDTNLYGYTWNDPINLIDPSGLLGAGVTYGGQVTVPGGGATATVSGIFGEDECGGVSAGASVQAGGSAVSAGYSVGQGPGVVVYSGTNQDYFSSGSLNINLPIISITILLDSNGNIVGGGISTRSIGLGVSYIPPNQTAGSSGVVGGGK